jgi:hypothetical protein
MALINLFHFFLAETISIIGRRSSFCMPSTDLSKSSLGCGSTILVISNPPIINPFRFEQHFFGNVYTKHFFAPCSIAYWQCQPKPQPKSKTLCIEALFPFHGYLLSYVILRHSTISCLHFYTNTKPYGLRLFPLYQRHALHMERMLNILYEVYSTIIYYHL